MSKDLSIRPVYLEGELLDNYYKAMLRPGVFFSAILRQARFFFSYDYVLTLPYGNYALYVPSMIAYRRMIAYCSLIVIWEGKSMIAYHSLINLLHDKLASWEAKSIIAYRSLIALWEAKSMIAYHSSIPIVVLFIEAVFDCTHSTCNMYYRVVVVSV